LVEEKMQELVDLFLDCQKRQMRELLIEQDQRDMSLVFCFLKGQGIQDVDAYSVPELRQMELDLEFYKLSTSHLDDFSDSIEVSTYHVTQILYQTKDSITIRVSYYLSVGGKHIASKGEDVIGIVASFAFLVPAC
jgi:hypothetical protein